MRALISSLAGASALLLLTACGGGGGSSSSGPNYATSLSYTDPTTGALRLVKDPASSGGTLVLDLVWTAASPISGVSFSASADTGKVAWTTPVQSNAFNLGTAPMPIITKVSGSELQFAVGQKGTASPITPTSTTVLAKVTMTLKANVSPGAITFTDSGKGAYLTSTGVWNTAVTVGTLQAQ